jgi:hypothetical protein
MSDRASAQADNVTPPRNTKIIALTVDSTARSYDLTAISLPDAYKLGQRNDVYLTLQADGAKIYLAFHSATASTLSDTAAVAAGAALAYSATYAGYIPDGAAVEVRISRDVDKFLQVKCASGSSAILRFWASSPPSARQP